MTVPSANIQIPVEIPLDAFGYGQYAMSSAGTANIWGSGFIEDLYN
jgi:hypothetical protein